MNDLLVNGNKIAEKDRVSISLIMAQNLLDFLEMIKRTVRLRYVFQMEIFFWENLLKDKQQEEEKLFMKFEKVMVKQSMDFYKILTKLEI